MAYVRDESLFRGETPMAPSIERSQPLTNTSETLKTNQDGMEEKKSVAELSIFEFNARIKLFQGPLVTVFVGPNETAFEISKDLLCFNSPFFDASFNGGFKEATEGKLYMVEDSDEIFGMLSQWIHTGNVTLKKKTSAQQLDLYLGFLKLADKVELLGPFTSFAGKIKEFLVQTEFKDGYRCPYERGHATKFDCFLGNDPWCGKHSPVRRLPADVKKALNDFDPLCGSILRADHLQTAYELPKSYGIRGVFVNACVPSYLQSFAWYSTLNLVVEGQDEFCYPFRFQEQLEELPGFAAELLQAVGKSVFAKPQVGGNYTTAVDPLTGGNIEVCSGDMEKMVRASYSHR